MTDLLNTLLEVAEAAAVPLLLAALVWLWNKWRTKGSKPEPRVRPEREPEIDLAKERWEFCCRRDDWLEDRELRRVA
jgi:hypothetical protein